MNRESWKRTATGSHTKRMPSVHTHAHKCAHPDRQCTVPRARWLEPPRILRFPEMLDPVTQAYSSFPQAHRVTSVHMQAARCYLCNHISTQPQFLPYKDIGSHCCMLFMVFHTHIHMRRATVLLQLHMCCFFPCKEIHTRSLKQTQVLLVQN